MQNVIVIVVSMGPYSCALFRIWRAYADWVAVSDIMDFFFFFFNLSSDNHPDSS